MLSTLVKEPVEGDEWLFEIKWDGYRAVGAWDGKTAELYSRNGLDFSAKFPEVFEQLKGLKKQAVLDGEIVAVDSEGYSRFEWLQNWNRKHEGNLTYFAFDLLWADGRDLRSWPLVERKRVLKQILPKKANIRYSDHVLANGRTFFETAQNRGLEGIIAKKVKSPYLPGHRGDEWLKIKTHMRQEVVIGGFTEPKGSRKYIGSLLAGVYENGDFVYVGHVSGMPPSQLKELHDKLEKLARKDSPFVNKLKPNSPAHWAKPKLVGEVNFENWTNDGLMRQPIFVGLRPDKAPQDVHREIPKQIRSKR
jgi:bifunctional non-homologous end joining protein LigD